ncbi:MAG: M3 family oligoendopeptidase, partial [bacterium]
ALDEYEYWSRTCGPATKATYYYYLLLDLNQGDSKLKAKFKKAEELSRDLENDIQFFTLRLAKIAPAIQREMLASKILAPYHHWLSRLFAESAHLLSEGEEKILSLKSSTSYFNWVRLTTDLLGREEREILDENGKKASGSLSSILGLLGSPKKKIRDTAAKGLNSILDKYLDVAEAEINSVLENHKINNDLRKFDRADGARLIEDNIDPEVVDTMLESVSRRFDITNKFYALKAKLLKVDKLAYHERLVPYGKEELRFTYDEAVERVKKVFSNLDADFVDIFSELVEKGRVDVLPTKGKVTGGYCSPMIITDIPTYVLVNFTNTLHDVLTLAHEAGHTINDELSKRAQNALNQGEPKSVAEVASTYMQDFVLSDIASEASEEAKLAILVRKIDDDISTVFRQVAAYRFEQELHRVFKETGHISKEDIGNMFKKHMAAYMGPAILQTKGCENWWISWHHFRDPFYVYSYASGQLISKAMQKETKANPEFILKVKEFLSAGTSDSPKNIFAKMGIDITRPDFWQEGLDEIENNLI